MWAEFHFLRPWWLLLLVPAATLAWLILRREAGGQAWRGIIAAHLLPHLLVGQEQQSRWRPAVLLSAFWGIGILALAGPTMQRQPAPFADDEIAVALIVECTETMLLQDVQPTRLERAGQKVADFLAQRPGIQAALFAYAGSAHRVMPFTTDPNILASFAGELRPDIMPVPGDAVAAAIALANSELRMLGKPGAIVLFTDGVEPAQATAAARARGAPVHVLAMGKSIDMSALQKAAAAMGGSMIAVTPDDRDVSELSKRVETNLQMVGPADGGERWADAGYWLVIVMLFPAVFWFRRGWTVRHD